MTATPVQEDPPEVLERFNSALPLVERMARKFHRNLDTRFDLDDLISAGREGLLEAARRYDPARGVPFTAYAHLRVRGGVIKAIRSAAELSEGAYKRAVALKAAATGSAHEVSLAAQEIAALQGSEGRSEAAAEQSLDQLMASFVTATAVGMVSEAVATDVSDSAASTNVEEEYERHELMAVVRDEVQNLDGREARVVSQMYFEHRTIDDLAAELGCDRSWVCRIHRKAIGRLGKRLKRLDLN